MKRRWNIHEQDGIHLESLFTVWEGSKKWMTQFAGIYRDKKPHLGKKAVIVMAADNGVVAEGVTRQDRK